MSKTNIRQIQIMYSPNNCYKPLSMTSQDGLTTNLCWAITEDPLTKASYKFGVPLSVKGKASNPLLHLTNSLRVTCLLVKTFQSK